MLLVLVLSGCSSSSPAATEGPEQPGVEAPVELSDYETFDPGNYPDQFTDDREELSHDVPAALLENRADAGVARIVPGYRIQVFSSVDRDEAIDSEERIKVWIESLSDSTRLQYDIPVTLPVYNQFNQPLYRIRVGDFTSRERAEGIMSLVARYFPRVFVVPDQVTVYR